MAKFFKQMKLSFLAYFFYSWQERTINQKKLFNTKFQTTRLNHYCCFSYKALTVFKFWSNFKKVSHALSCTFSKKMSHYFWICFNVELIKCHFLFFNCTSLCSFIECLLLYVNGFLKMFFSLIELTRFVFPGIFVTACLSLTPLLPKEIILKQKKSAKHRKYKNCQKPYPTFYILWHSLLIICLLLLFNKIKQPKELRMSYNNNRNTTFFSINILEIQDSTWNSCILY